VIQRTSCKSVKIEKKNLGWKHGEQIYCYSLSDYNASSLSTADKLTRKRQSNKFSGFISSKCIIPRVKKFKVFRRDIIFHVYCDIWFRVVETARDSATTRNQILSHTIGGDRIVRPFWNIASPFRPTTRQRREDCATTMRRRDVVVQHSSCNACGRHLQDPTNLLLDCPHPSHSGAPPLAILLFLISGPDLGAWPDCWISVEIFHAHVPRKDRVAPPPP